MKTDKGQRIIAAILCVGGAVGLAQAAVALIVSASPPMWTYVVYPAPFLLSVIGGVGLWRDTQWGRRLSIGLLLAQVLFIWSPSVAYLLYTGVALPVMITFNALGESSVSIAAWLGSDFTLVFSGGGTRYGGGLNVAPILALAYLTRIRRTGGETLSAADKTSLWSHPDTAHESKPRIRPYH